MRLFWRVYYYFKTTRNRSQQLIKHCRLNGVPFIKLRLAYCKPEDFIGIPDRIIR
jgi:hypothetical protein